MGIMRRADQEFRIGQKLGRLSDTSVHQKNMPIPLSSIGNHAVDDQLAEFRR